MFSPPHLLGGAGWAEMRVGLLGGSFNPPHHGHLHISRVALETLKLDAVWWLVTPQNPLKESADLMPYEERTALCRELAAEDPHIVVTDIEREIGTNLSWETVRALTDHFRRTDFVWITGMDIALTIHHWHNWRDLLGRVATAHIARPPALTLIENCPLKMLTGQNHVFLDKARKVDLKPRNSYWLMQKKMVSISSTEIRENSDLS
jgi:nicotinate-nucleotide adenylyltransferase